MNFPLKLLTTSSSQPAAPATTPRNRDKNSFNPSHLLQGRGLEVNRLVMPNTRSTIPNLNRQLQANDLIERGQSFRMRSSDLLLAVAVMVVAVVVFVFRAWVWDTDTQPC